jgi:site-specific recombinase XerD
MNNEGSQLTANAQPMAQVFGSLLFASAKGQPITSCYLRRDILHPIRERLGIPRGEFDAFRHGLGTELMRVGANPPVVQEQFGHADLKMLQRYALVVPRRNRRNAVERHAQMRHRYNPLPHRPASERRGNNRVELRMNASSEVT